jgi:hypothetical protein
MITRKAILLRYSENDLEDYRTNLDFGLIKYFLKSGTGGCFEDTEIIEMKINEIENKQELFILIDSVDYSFIYYTGHSVFFNRQVHLPLNAKLMRASDLERRNKKQWFFFDCCRTGKIGLQSPKFTFNIESIRFSTKTVIAKNQWMQDIESFTESSLANYYVTEIGEDAFINEDGGYGTQLFFITLSKLLQNREEIHLKELVSIINEKEDTLQKGVLWSDNAEKIIFRN